MAGDSVGRRLERLEEQMAAVLRRLGAVDVEEPVGVERGDEQPTRVGGTVDISGALRLGDRDLVLQHRMRLADALESEPAVLARVFAALGSPFRVRLVCALLEAPRTSQELQTQLSVPPVGQLYHHLKELLAAGLIVQRKRGVYSIREEIVMPMCMALAVAPRLAATQRDSSVLVEELEGPDVHDQQA